MEVDESINNDEYQLLRVVNQWCTHHRMFVPSYRMSHILSYVRVALATSDVQSILEIPATDEIRHGVLPELSQTMAYTTRNTVNRLARKQLHLNHGLSERTKGGINLYIELEKH